MIVGNPMIFLQSPLEDAIHRMAELGYESLELWPRQIEACRTPAQRERFARFVERAGLKLIRMNAADPPYFQALDMSASAAASDGAIVAGLVAEAKRAADFGMRQLLTWEGRVPPGADRQQRFGSILHRTANIFQRAFASGNLADMSISIEVHPFTLGIDVEWLLRLCEEVGSDSFGVTYDSCHFGVGLPTRYVEAIGQIGRHLHHVHYSDSDTVTSEVHFAPGTGVLNLDAIDSALADIGFSGSLMLDLYQDPLPVEGSHLGIARLRKLLAQLRESSPKVAP
jgi:sugar phosphate isomerase/epimerase